MQDMYAFITEAEGGFALFIGKDVPGEASHGAAQEVGWFDSAFYAAETAVMRGVRPEAITDKDGKPILRPCAQCGCYGHEQDECVIPPQ